MLKLLEDTCNLSLRVLYPLVTLLPCPANNLQMPMLIATDFYQKSVLHKFFCILGMINVENEM